MCDFHVNLKIMFGHLNEITVIASVGIYALYPWEGNDKHCQKGVCGFGIMDICRSCRSLQNISVLISYYIALHSFNFLVAVYSLLGTRQTRTGAFAVNGTNRGLRRLASPKSYRLHKTVLKLGKCVHRSPTSEIVVHCLSLGVFFGQQSPLAAADIYEDDGIKYEKKIIFAALIIHENCSSYILLLSISQICQIHNSLVLFRFIHLLKQSSKHKCLKSRLMLIFYSHLFLNKL